MAGLWAVPAIWVVLHPGAGAGAGAARQVLGLLASGT